MLNSIVQEYRTNEQRVNLDYSAPMRPLYHPAIEDVTVQGVLYALSDPIRVQIFAELVARDKPQPCCALIQLTGKPLPKSTLSQHFRILREAGLILSERKGVELHNRSRCEDLSERFGLLIQEILKAYAVENTRTESASDQHSKLA